MLLGGTIFLWRATASSTTMTSTNLLFARRNRALLDSDDADDTDENRFDADDDDGDIKEQWKIHQILRYVTLS